MSTEKGDGAGRLLFYLFHQLLRQRHQAADAHGDIHHLPGHVAGHPAAEAHPNPQPRQHAGHAQARRGQQRGAEIAAGGPHGEVDDVGGEEQELHIGHIGLLVPGDGHEVQGHHRAADGERAGAAPGKRAAHKAGGQGRLQLYPPGEEQEIHRQRHQKRAEGDVQRPQIQAAQQTDDHQAARGIQGDGQGDLLQVDMPAVQPRHRPGLGSADQRHQRRGNGDVVIGGGRHHHNDRRAEARQGLNDAAHQRGQGHHDIGHSLHLPNLSILRAL